MDTFTTRPISVDDLPEHERRAHVIAEVTGLQFCTAHPEVGQHLLAALAAARDAGLTVEPNGRITVPLTEEEQDAALTGAQRSWDSARDRYLAALTDPASIPHYARYTVDQFAAREDREPIMWPTSEPTS